MSDIPKIAKGTPAVKMPSFNAAWQNSVSEMLNWYLRMKAAGEITNISRALESSSGIVKVKNLTGSDLLRGNYVQLGDYLLDDVEHHKQFYEGNLYDAAESGRIAILERAVKDGDTSFVRARLLGKCTARVNVTDTGHRFAAPDDGEYLLKSAASGDIEILSVNKISGTGEQELAVVLGGGGGRTSTTQAVFMVVTSLIDVATGDISHIIPAQGTAQLYSTDPATKERVPTEDEPVDVFNYDPSVSYPVRTGIWCVFHRISSPGGGDPAEFYEVISSACAPFDEMPE